jgi:hypothetical protein
MALTEIEFELAAEQFALMGYPNLRQGQPLMLQLETGFLVPDSSAEGWYAVQKERLPAQFVRVGWAQYAFSGQISDADLVKEGDTEIADVIVQCGEIPLCVSCAPHADGRLPYGTWETRYLAGFSRIRGVVEDGFESVVGEQIGVTIWSFRRLVLTPGDPRFGDWHETAELLSTPYKHDRIVVTARVHRRVL